jgi:hypothetical protein
MNMRIYKNFVNENSLDFTGQAPPSLDEDSVVSAEDSIEALTFKAEAIEGTTD